jgi:glycosyltransferase involved in cell wall biosynthesis
VTVTVLMVTHNEESCVEAAVSSLRDQSFEDWDLLVVDDASTDQTPALLAMLASGDRRVHVLRNAANVGLAASLNRGLRESKTDLIARLDGDDTCFPDRLAAQVRYLSEHPDVAVLGTGAELRDEQGRLLGVALRPERHESLVARIFQENPFIHPSVMARREFFEACGGYDERLRRAQDYDLWLRGYRRFRYQNLTRALIRYRVRRKPRLDALVYGAFMLLRAARREGRLATKGWYALRYLGAGVATRMGLWSTRLR